MIQQYRVTYDSLNIMCIVHCKENKRPNMHFIMHESGIHYYDPAEDFTFVTTVADKKKHYSKQQIKAADRVAKLYGTVTYPSVSDYRWYIQSNQIKEFPVTVQDIDATITIWGKDIFYLKRKTTSKNTIPVT